jgi:site-specific DNA recombinase
MNQKNGKRSSSGRSGICCAIYTRKSTEEGLEQEFNSLDAQRESAEAYIASQRHESWLCSPERYDDGGYTGGNMDRPALARILADIAAGKIQVVVVYKVDRLSRSLLDFAKMMETFDKHQVSFVSVTQQFNTATSIGRLVLNVLLSFAQFEREIISERTRDKIAAARRKGKWSGGRPLLGYDVDPRGSKLIVNAAEAAQVGAIFGLYLEYGGLIPVVQELERRGWVNKQWVTRKGKLRGGTPFTKTSLYQLLTNVTYMGKVKYKTEVHGGEHVAIVDEAVWQAVQSSLRGNGATSGSAVPNRFGAFLKGLLCCAPCECAMTPTYAARHEGRRYRYYVCCNAQKRGWSACPSKALPAGEIEGFVLERIANIAEQPAILEGALVEAEAEKNRAAGSDDAAAGRVVGDRILPRSEEGVALGRALSGFRAAWDTLPYDAQARLVRLVVDQVDYDGAKHKVAIRFHPIGIVKLARELTGIQERNP